MFLLYTEKNILYDVSIHRIEVLFKGGNEVHTKQKQKWRFWIELLLIGVLIFTGTALIGRTFAEYGGIFLKNQDEQLLHFAELIDRNIDSLLKRCSANLNYVTRRRGFLEAEEQWLKTGNTEELRYRMQENILAYDNLVPAMLAIRGEEVAVSSDGKMYYRLQKKNIEKEITTCTGPDGTIYLALLCEGTEDVRYAALIDLETFYGEIVGQELAEYDWIILTDEARDILLYNQQGRFRVEETDAVSGATCGSEGVEILLRQQEKQSLGTASYEYSDGDTKNNYTARMVSLPTGKTRNQVFAVGVVTNFEDIITSLETAGALLLLYGGMVFAGVLLLVKRVLGFRKKSEEDREELQLMQEKNDTMAEQNEELKKLAHRQRLETIGTLTSGIAHEFNNLLTPIMGYSILTLEQIPEDREDLQDNILEIYQASCRAKEITSQLARLSRKSDASASQKIVLDDLIGKVLRVAMPVMPETVEISQQLQAGDAVVEGDETQLSQMILNLVLNGFQAMEKTGGTLTVMTALAEESILLKVADTGPGIPEQIIGKVFEPFFTTKEAGKGTGLGLAIVQQVVNEHHGSIRAESGDGQGAVFTVQLPIGKE